MSPSAIHRQWTFDVPLTGLAVNRNGDWVMAAFGDGSARFFPAQDRTQLENGAPPKSIHLHHGVSLSLRMDADAHGFLSGGDDGCVMLIDPELATATPLAEHKGQWIDHVAGSADFKYRAYNVGKKLYICDDEGKAKFQDPLLLPGTPGDLCFSPNGKRLAVSHYNGVSLYWMNTKENTPTKLEWKGSHLDVAWSSDGKSLLTCLQENALHGWQIIDGKEMRMQGYATKPRSMSFSARGKYLVTSGADQIICWPFSGGGPWGKPPLALGGSDARVVTSVAAHPKDEMTAAGYSDGLIVLAPLDGRMEILIAPPTGSEVVGLVWNTAGEALYAGTASGTVMLFTLDSVRRAVVNSA